MGEYVNKRNFDENATMHISERKYPSENYGNLIKVHYGDDFLVDKYTISINKQKYKDNKFKNEVYKNIRDDMGLTDKDKENIELIFRRCVIKCIE